MLKEKYLMLLFWWNSEPADLYCENAKTWSYHKLHIWLLCILGNTACCLWVLLGNNGRYNCRYSPLINASSLPAHCLQFPVTCCGSHYWFIWLVMWQWLQYSPVIFPDFSICIPLVRFSVNMLLYALIYQLWLKFIMFRDNTSFRIKLSWIMYPSCTWYILSHSG